MGANSTYDIDRLAEMAHAGALRAADAFARLVDVPIRAIPPVVVPSELPRIPNDPRSAGVFFELDGRLDASLGILFSGMASEALVQRIVGEQVDWQGGPVVESAIMETGNILASHVVSAIAERVGERLVPSIPLLAMGQAHRAFEEFVSRSAGAPTVRLESSLVSAEEPLGGILVLVSAG